MKYDPNNELTDEQMNKLSEDDFFEYLDSKAKYLSQFTKPLGEYHTKRFAVMNAAMEGRHLTEEEYQTAKKIGKEGDMINQKRIVDKIKKL